jgi:hypothetical protein
MWQETGIIIIGILTFGYAGWLVYRFFVSAKSQKSAVCTNCTSDCALKNQAVKQAIDCEREEKERI